MVQQHVSLQPYNTFGIAATARYFSTFINLEQLQEILSYAHQKNSEASRSPLVLGGGSNLLLTGDYNGLVMKNEIGGIAITGEDANHVYVRAGAGVNWHHLVMYCINHNLAGVENLSLIPGNTGASPMQNIGAYGVEIKDVFHELEAFHMHDKTLTTFGLNDCAFGYRESIFKRQLKGQFIITSVVFRLNKVPVYHTSYGAIEQELAAMGVQVPSIRNISQAVINIRSSKLPDPVILGNAGSFFKNPEINEGLFEKLRQAFPAIVGYPLPGNKVKLAAGWLIEQCGWKGYRKGDAGCHAQQALVLVNYGSATGQDIVALSNAIIESVQKQFGVLLEREVNVV